MHVISMVSHDFTFSHGFNVNVNWHPVEITCGCEWRRVFPVDIYACKCHFEQTVASTCHHGNSVAKYTQFQANLNKAINYK